MSTFEHLTNLLLTAERSSIDRAVTIDLFYRSGDGVSQGALVPIWGNDSAPVGRVLAECGRICWVIAKGNDLTLSDMLSTETGVPLATFERIYQSAKQEGIPFCEKLASSDVIDVGQVRRTLRNHAASALASLAHIAAQEEVAYSIAGVPYVTYDPDFTFGTLELLQSAVSASPELRGQLGPLPSTFSRMAPKLETAICFRESESSDLSMIPVAAWCKSDVAVGDAIELASLALPIAQPDDLVAAEIAPFSLFTHESTCWLTSYQEPYLSVFQVDDRGQYLALMQNLVETRKREAETPTDQ